MNERIRELEDRCWQELGEEEGMYPVFNTEKFAQLIVRECALMCLEDNDSQRILEHFGVEE